RRIRRGAITKTGNAHLRRVVIEAAWAYRYRPAVGAPLRKRQASASEEVKAIAWKAQHRLHARYCHLTAHGKNKQQTVTAIGRELLGFIWVFLPESQSARQSAYRPRDLNAVARCQFVVLVGRRRCRRDRRLGAC